MATIDDVMTTLAAECTEALASVQLDTLAYPGWPQQQELLEDLKNRIVNVSVYPSPHGERNTTRFAPVFRVVREPVANLSAVLSAVKLQGGIGEVAATATIELRGSINEGVVAILYVGGAYVPFHPVTGATLEATAAALAAAINNDASASTVVTASVAPSLTGVVLTAREPGMAGNSIPVRFSIGGTGVVSCIEKTQTHDFEIHVWAYDNDARKLVGDALERHFTHERTLTWEDGEMFKLRYAKQVQTDAEIKHGIYRRIVYYSVEYPTTYKTEAVQVLEGRVSLNLP